MPLNQYKQAYIAEFNQLNRIFYMQYITYMSNFKVSKDNHQKRTFFYGFLDSQNWDQLIKLRKKKINSLI
ncbi:hypothetical protein pb186bvf_016430 [Paramecium bursaria]